MRGEGEEEHVNGWEHYSLTEAGHQKLQRVEYRALRNTFRKTVIYNSVTMCFIFQQQYISSNGCLNYFYILRNTVFRDASKHGNAWRCVRHHISL